MVHQSTEFILNLFIGFKKGQLTKITESLADNLNEMNIYALKFGQRG